MCSSRGVIPVIVFELSLLWSGTHSTFNILLEPKIPLLGLERGREILLCHPNLLIVWKPGSALQKVSLHYLTALSQIDLSPSKIDLPIDLKAHEHFVPITLRQTVSALQRSCAIPRCTLANLNRSDLNFSIYSVKHVKNSRDWVGPLKSTAFCFNFTQDFLDYRKCL